MVAGQKLVDPDWLNTNFPCLMACPAHSHAGRYVALIAEGRFEEAYAFARGPNPLASICGRVCGHPCETACRRGQIDKPVAIRALKRFLCERYGPESHHRLEVNPMPGPRRPHKVAVIGSGPAGLAAAHDLALMGYAVTIFEAAPVAGGMISHGIPPYRLPSGVIEAQVREILSTGDITLRVNQAAGSDFSVTDLRRQGFDAVLIAVGAQRGRGLLVPGIDLAGVHQGIEFFFKTNAGEELPIGKRVIIIGGGSTAMDVARTAAREVLRQRGAGSDVISANEKGTADATRAENCFPTHHKGSQGIHIVCLEQRDNMPAAPEEIEAAVAEGIILHPGLGPKRILGHDGKVIGLETLKVQQVFDREGRFNPTFYENSEAHLACDMIIVAIGQTTQLDFLSPDDGVEVSSRGLIVVNPESLMTKSPGIFAGGDCVFGPRLMIDAVGDGKRAALGIDEYLSGRRHAEPRIEVEILRTHQMPQKFLPTPRQPIPELPIEQRNRLAEVEADYDEETAQAEARRCLRCWINTVFEGSEVDGSRCTLCGGCVEVCPEDCLQLVALDRIEFTPGTIEALRNNRRLLGVELDDLAAEELGIIAGSVMIKDETRCIRCGLCAERCPVKTITMEAYQLVSDEPGPLIPVQAQNVNPLIAGSRKDRQIGGTADRVIR
jgi:NADPH-dependent glutamate synthase beta subunit-like oxidoreductase/ferredoxin